MYDQMLIRPGIMKQLKHVEILDHDGTRSLLNRRGVPNKQSASDHLPVFFQLDFTILEKEQ